MRKLVGNTEIQDSLQKLDRLTQEEAWMASVELLNVTHDVDAKVIGINDRVKGIKGKVEDVQDNMQDVGNKVQDVNNRVQDIGSDINDISC